ncbi:hypothetical protein P8452_55098 [Trifolium repens]|nr:hypothetical protein P8452_55098 [Trifolium repens]
MRSYNLRSCTGLIGPMGRIYRGSFPRVIPLATSKASRAITTIYNGHIGIQKLLSERALVATIILDEDCKNDSECIDIKCKPPRVPRCTENHRLLVATSIIVDKDCKSDIDCYDVKCKLPQRPWCTQNNRCECLPPVDCESDSDCFDVKCKLPERPWCTQYNRCECLPPDEASLGSTV